ncbi:hypothetical protein R3W88_004506 [Solanum pinnatisectum]|uniref:DUF4283 domain-containing protein n=1 Tax=Solanum pinnatisectum TaxID=50273 RepID=A0AAV9KAT9_9SOLN|nr:hypothetical protein R3W88_004506 [Solanum pinnatisectum]
MPLVDPAKENCQIGKALTYILSSLKNGIPTVKIEEEDIREHAKTWDPALIGYLLGDSPTEQLMKKIAKRVWGFVKTPKRLIHDEGYFIFKFYTNKDKEEVLKYGPYYFNNRPEKLSLIPIWVMFPGSPVGYWPAETLTKVASAVGRPLHTDNVTANADKISYA